MHYPSVTRVTPLTTIRRQRLLPVPGDVLARVGDRVDPTQVVARANLPGNFRILPVAHTLGVPASEIQRYLRVSLDDVVKRGDVVAKKGRLGGTPVKSPIDGTVTAASGGRLLIEARPRMFELRAYLYGTVSNVLHHHGVVVETTGALVQGVWGTDSESLGILKRITESPDEPLDAQSIDPSCHGMILVGGAGLSGEALERAQEVQVRGIVVGGMAPELISQAKQMSFPVIVTEGLGVVPMSTPVFRLLATNDGREASISGRVQFRWGIVRPEIIIPLPAETLPPVEDQPGALLQVGTRVRMVRAPDTGTAGTIVALPNRPREIETGARVLGALVDLGQEEPIFAPLANLEILR
jgi:hypothetical protein